MGLSRVPEIRRGGVTVSCTVLWRRRWIITAAGALHAVGLRRLSRRLLDFVVFDVYAGERRIARGRLADYLA